MSITNATNNLAHKLTRPEKLYKYMSFETAKIVLANKTLRVSHVSQFNDPLDSLPEIDFDAEEVCSHIQSPEGVPIVLEELQKSLLRLPFTTYLALLSKKKFPDFAPIIDLITHSNEKNEIKRGQIIYLLQPLLNHLLSNKRYKLLCFAKSQYDNAMWGYYAKNHTGVVIEFDANLSINHNILKPRGQEWVGYPESQSNFTKFFIENVKKILENPKDKKPFIDEIISSIFFTKHPTWQHEQEFRYVYQDLGNKIVPDYRDCGFSLEAIKSVYFGYHCSDTNIVEMQPHIPTSTQQFKMVKESKIGSLNLEFVDVRDKF